MRNKITIIIAFVAVWPLHRSAAGSNVMQMDHINSNFDHGKFMDKALEGSTSLNVPNISKDTVKEPGILGQTQQETLTRLQIWKIQHKICRYMPVKFPGCKRISLLEVLTGKTIPSVHTFLEAFKQAAVYNSLHMHWIQDKATGKNNKTSIPTKYNTMELIFHHHNSKRNTMKYNKRWVVTRWPSRRKSIPPKPVVGNRKLVSVKSRNKFLDSKYVLIGIGR